MKKEVTFQSDKLMNAEIYPVMTQPNLENKVLRRQRGF